jgi:uncharacterized protein YgbK (DUF1537 family)
VTEVTVVADDLTGAADCGIAFALAGLSTFVSIGDAPAPDSAQIVSIDTDSRRLDELEASVRAGQAATNALRRGSRALYKKIDSTLRGPVAAELAAILRAADPAIGVFAPAFPATGRTLRDARVIVSGVLLEETEVWRTSGMTGPAQPLPMLRRAGLTAESIPLGTVRSNLPAALAALARRGVQVAVCDAEEEDDLRRIADAGAAFDRRIVWTGSGGLARHLPAALGLRPRPDAGLLPDLASGPVLTLVGSRSTIAREQARLLAAEDGVATFVLEPDVLLGGPASPGWKRAGADLRRELDAGHDVLLLTSLQDSADLAIDPALAGALGRFAAEVLERIGGVVATGGDIARAVLTAIGAGGLHLLGEAEPAVPVGIADAKRPIPVVTKAGAFGAPETLKRSRMALKHLIREGARAARAGAGGSC